MHVSLKSKKSQRIGHIKIIQNVSEVINVILSKIELNPKINEKDLTIKAKLKKKMTLSVKAACRFWLQALVCPKINQIHINDKVTLNNSKNSENSII